MRNIFLLPTDNEQHSIVQKNIGLLLVQTPRNEYSGAKLNLNITSNEEIKGGDWYINLLDNKIWKAEPNFFNTNGIIGSKLKKIILTTDTTLIVDGVQAIDNQFLDWFVKHPNCEFVDVDKTYRKRYVSGFLAPDLKGSYKIIIPQEEDEDEEDVECNMCGGSMCLSSDESIYICTNSECTRCYEEDEDDEPKQETLEQASLNWLFESEEHDNELSFIKGAEWMEKRMYSEEEVDLLVNELINKVTDWSGSYVYKDKLIEMYEQLKKK